MQMFQVLAQKVKDSQCDKNVWKEDEVAHQNSIMGIKALLLAHITVIQISCVKNGESISPQTMNNKTVERFWGDDQKMVGGSPNKRQRQNLTKQTRRQALSMLPNSHLSAIILQKPTCLVGIKSTNY
jgi:hypothetical protein